MLEWTPSETPAQEVRRVLAGAGLDREDQVLVAEAQRTALELAPLVAAQPEAATRQSELDERVLAVVWALAPVPGWERDAGVLAGERVDDRAAVSLRALVASARLEAAVELAGLHDRVATLREQALTREALHAGNDLSGTASRTLEQAGLLTEDVDFALASLDGRIDAALRSGRHRSRTWAVAVPPERGLGRSEQTELAALAREQERDAVRDEPSAGRSAATVAPLLLGLLGLPVVGVLWAVDVLVPGLSVPGLVPLTVVVALGVLLPVVLTWRPRRVAVHRRRALTGPSAGSGRTGDLAARAVEAGLALRRSPAARNGGELWGLLPEQVHVAVWDACRAARTLDSAPGRAGADPPLVLQALGLLRVEVVNLEVAAAVVGELDGQRAG